MPTIKLTAMMADPVASSYNGARHFVIPTADLICNAGQAIYIVKRGSDFTVTALPDVGATAFIASTNAPAGEVQSGTLDDAYWVPSQKTGTTGITANMQEAMIEADAIVIRLSSMDGRTRFAVSSIEA